jgi:hypothetical protein
MPTDYEFYSRLAAKARIAAIKLDRCAGRAADAAKARANALRYEKLAKLSKLGRVCV